MPPYRASPLGRPPSSVAPGADLSEGATAADEEFRALAAKIARETRFPCESYKAQVLRRRIAVRMRACKAPTYGEYARVLDSDAGEYAQLLDALTVNVTRFFRDPPTYAALASAVVPQLWSAADDEIAVWSAGTASGEEAYSLAALFHDEAQRRGEGERLGRARVIGTDIDRASLLTAARAEYPPSAFSETPPEILDRLFPRTGTAHPGETRSVSASLRAMVRIQRRDLLREPPPTGGFDLIACRNVIIYLDRGAQEALLSTLHAALRPGGFLVLGRAEMLLGPSRTCFVPVVPRERIFQRSDATERCARAYRG